MPAICTVSGPLIDPTGAVLVNTVVRFVRVDRVGGTGTATVVGRDVTVTSNGSGVVTVDLLAGSYTALVNGSATQFEFAVGVPDAATASLHDCIEQAPEITPGLVQQVVDLRDEVVLIEERIDLGALDAAVEQTGLDRIATAADVVAADAARIAAETAREVALAGAGAVGSYAATTQAAAIMAGIAGVADGAVFRASGDDVDRVETRRRSGSGSTLLWQEPKSTVVGLTTTIGIAPANTGSTIGSDHMVIDRTEAAAGDMWGSVPLAVNAAGLVDIAIVTMSGNNIASVVWSQAVTVAAGVNTIANINRALLPGQYRAVWVTGAVGLKANLNTSAGFPVWVSSGALASGTACTQSTQHTYQLRFTVLSGHAARITKAEQDIVVLRTDADYLLTTVGQSGTIGPTVANTGTAYAPSTAIFLADTTTVARPITRAIFALGGAGSVTVMVGTLSGSALTVRKSVVVSALAGMNNIPVEGITQNPGEIVGILATGLIYNPSTNPTGQRVHFVVSAGVPAPGTTLTINSTAHQWQFAFSWATGTLNSSGGGLPVGTGLDAMATADPNGVEDATAILAAARAAHPYPYIRPGTFAVTALPGGGEGLYGPGNIMLNGTPFFIPAAPRLGNLQDLARSALMEHIGRKNTLVVIGDSNTHYPLDTTTGADHWLNLMTRFLNRGVAVEEPIMTALYPSHNYTPAFYGVAVTGGTMGTAGPLARSLILAAGDYMEFTGAYEDVEVWCEQKPGAGTLTLTRNGVTIGSKNYAGSAASNVYSAFGVTGNSASATYRITASVGPVEIVGLQRDAPMTALTPTGKNRLRVMRAANAGYMFPLFGAPAITSIMAMAAQFGGVGVPIINLGVNDAAANSLATIISTAGTMIDRLEAAGAPEIFGIIPLRPTVVRDSSYVSGQTYEAAMAELRRLYRQRGVMTIGLDGIDWANSGGLLADGIHYPSGEPQRRVARAVLEGIIKAKGL